MKTLQKRTRRAKAKRNAQRPAPAAGVELMRLLPKRRDGWWLDASRFTPDVPEYGPYDTRGEAIEARRSFLRSRSKRQIEEARNTNH